MESLKDNLTIQFLGEAGMVSPVASGGGAGMVSPVAQAPYWWASLEGGGGGAGMVSPVAQALYWWASLRLVRGVFQTS